MKKEELINKEIDNLKSSFHYGSILNVCNMVENNKAPIEAHIVETMIEQRQDFASKLYALYNVLKNDNAVVEGKHIKVNIHTCKAAANIISIDRSNMLSVPSINVLLSYTWEGLIQHIQQIPIETSVPKSISDEELLKLQKNKFEQSEIKEKLKIAVDVATQEVKKLFNYRDWLEEEKKE